MGDVIRVSWNNFQPPFSTEFYEPYDSNNTSLEDISEGVVKQTWIGGTNGGYRYTTRLVERIPTVSMTHIYYLSYMINPSASNMYYGIEFAGGVSGDNSGIWKRSCPQNTWTRLSFRAQGRRDGAGYGYFGNRRDGVISLGDYVLLKSPIYIDLTQMFGAGNEPNLEEFEAQCTLNGIDLTQSWAQDSGTERDWIIPHYNQQMMERKKQILISSPHIESINNSIASFKTDMIAPLRSAKVYFEPKQDLNGYDKPWVGGSGNNIWDEEWEVGRFDTTTGENISSSQIRSKNYIPVIPNTEYRFVGPTSIWIIPFDENKNVLSEQYFKNATATSGNSSTFNSNSIFTTPTNCYFIKFYLLVGYGVTYNNDIAINYPSSVTTYSPYKNICPISGWIEISEYQTGKNLVVENEIKLNTYVRGEVTATGTVIGSEVQLNSWQCTGYIKVLPNTEYTITYTWANAAAAGLCFFADANLESAISGISMERMKSGVYTFTTPETCNYLRFSGGKNNTFMSLIQGSTAFDGEIYSSTMTPINWADSAGIIYSGYVDLVTGKCSVNWACYTFTGNESLENYSPGARNNRYAINLKTMLKYDYDSTRNTEAICSHFKCVTLYTSAIYGEVSMDQRDGWFQVSDPNYENWGSLAGYKTWLADQYAAGTPLQVAFPLVTPITYDLTPQTLKTLRGINNIWSDAGPVEVQYWTH